MKSFLTVLLWFFSVIIFVTIFSLTLKYFTNNSLYINLGFIIIISVSYIIVILLIRKYDNQKLYLNYLQIKIIFYSLMIGLILFLLYPITNLNVLLKNIIEKSISLPTYNYKLDFYGYKFYHILNSIIVMPILEELFFRGIILSKLKFNLSKNKAIFLSSLFFAIGHMEFEKFSLTLFSGIIFSMLYLKYKNILYPIITHIIVNTLFVFFKYNTESVSFSYFYIYFFYLILLGMIFYLLRAKH